ncbi:Abi family protein [uncultured Actinomyces sp.]|uniref:Abi family protein n=1 Tax=uncultured Actinomyces sp. TaxID=249061 RepID=UPI002617B239|nr:Abi family protein [uncultured Actinomyces sp.]
MRKWLSVSRWQPYLAYCDGDERRALALYEWNLHLAGAVLHDVAHVEVAIRNAYDQAFSAHWSGGSSWLLDSCSPVQERLERKRRGRLLDANARNRASISEAVSRVGSAMNTGAIIAELPFGFWRHLTDAAHEKTVWVPYLNHAFPKGTNRKRVEQSLALINTVRNRASHHEPLFTDYRRSEVENASKHIIGLEELLLPELATHTRSTSQINHLLGNLPYERTI